MTDALFASAGNLLDAQRRMQMGFHARQIGIFLVLGLGVLLLFAYFYFQEWWLKRRMRQLTEMSRLRQARAQATAQPPPPRLPLIRVRPARRTSAPSKPARANESGQSRAEAQTEVSASSPGQRGRLEIYAEEAACEVFIDGAFIGNAPARLTLPEGVHVVEVKHPEGAVYRREIYVSEAADLRLQATWNHHPESQSRD